MDFLSSEWGRPHSATLNIAKEPTTGTTFQQHLYLNEFRDLTLNVNPFFMHLNSYWHRRSTWQTNTHVSRSMQQQQTQAPRLATWICLRSSEQNTEVQQIQFVPQNEQFSIIRKVWRGIQANFLERNVFEQQILISEFSAEMFSNQILSCHSSKLGVIHELRIALRDEFSIFPAFTDFHPIQLAFCNAGGSGVGKRRWSKLASKSSDMHEPLVSFCVALCSLRCIWSVRSR